MQHTYVNIIILLYIHITMMIQDYANYLNSNCIIVSFNQSANVKGVFINVLNLLFVII